jgi:transporter family-2 protein
MYDLLVIFSGIVISVMVLLNGGLTQSYGTYLAAVIIHIVGVIFAITLCIIRKEKFNQKSHAPVWAYLGGAFGVLTTLFSNYAFGKISMTSIIALGLLGQSLTSVLLDSFGWFGIQKRPINKISIIGFLPAIAGVFLMMDQSVSKSLLAVILSLIAGITIVLSRTVNARLSAQTSPLIGSFFNHLVGLPICILLFLCLQGPVLHMTTSAQPWMYLGGVLGVVTVLLLNITVPKVSAFRLTLLSFTGQVFTGVILDMTLGMKSSNSTFAGGLIIAGGLLLNMALDRWCIGRKQAGPI